MLNHSVSVGLPSEAVMQLRTLLSAAHAEDLQGPTSQKTPEFSCTPVTDEGLEERPAAIRDIM